MTCDAKKLMMLSIQGQMSSPWVPPFHVWSDPGEGKTATCNWLVDSYEIDLFHKDAVPQAMPADFAGYAAPDFDNGVMRMLPPKHAKDIQNLGGSAFILYDELGDAPRSTQSAAHGALLDKRLGEVDMVTDQNMVAMGGCSNPPTTNTTGETLSWAVSNRLFHVWWDEGVDEWADNMEAGFPTADESTLLWLSEDWEKHVPKYRSLVKAFSRRFPDSIVMSGEARALRRQDSWKPWHSKRSWTHGVYMMALCEGAGEMDLLDKALAGCVGEDVATEYFTWVNNLDIPDPEAVLADPSGFVMPPRGDQVYVLAISVIEAVKRKTTRDRWNAAWGILDRFVTGGFADIGSAMGSRLFQAGKGYGRPPNLSTQMLDIMREADPQEGQGTR